MRVITATLDKDDRPEAIQSLTPALAAPHWVATLHDHGPLLLAAARAITRDEAEAEDLVQTTFERALLAAPTIRDPRAIRAWLLTVQTREALRVVRRLRRTLHLDPTIHELPVGGPDVSESIELDEAAGQAVATDPGRGGPPPYGRTLRPRNGGCAGCDGEHREGTAQDRPGATPGVLR